MALSHTTRCEGVQVVKGAIANAASILSGERRAVRALLYCTDQVLLRPDLDFRVSQHLL